LAYSPSLLWKISSQNLKAESYLFGSIHTNDNRLEALKNLLIPFMQSCANCAVEVSIDEALAADLRGYHLLLSEQHHSLFINPAKWQKIDENLISHFGFELKQHEHLKPLVILNLILQRLFLGSDTQVLDEWIWEFGKSSFKNMFGLETIEDHYITLNKIPLALQYKLFFKAVKDPLKMQRRFEHLFKKYFEQDIRFMYRDAKKSSSGARHLLLKDRNIKMAHMIEQCILNGNTFSAVGAAHLYGQYGIIHLLQKKVLD